MSARIGAVERRTPMVIRQALPVVLLVALLIWIAIAAARGAMLALQTAGIAVGGDAQRSHATPEMVQAAVLVYFVCLTAALLTRWLHAQATLPVTYAAGGLVVLTGAIGTGSIRALVVVLGMFALAWLLGDVLLRRLPPTAALPVVRLPISAGLGIGLLGLLLLLLATLGILNNAIIVITGAGAILLALVAIDREHLATKVRAVRFWRPLTPTWFETVVTGMTVGLVAFALLTAFVPENTSDAIRQHLPIAREIWQTSSAFEIPFMGVSRDPIQGHLLYAVAWGLGGMSAAKLVHAVVGLLSIIGVAGMGWLNAGRTGAVVGAAIFATMPVVLWELGHAFLDLFPVLFTVACVLCLQLWQRDGSSGWLVCAGALAGFGFAAKVTMGWVAVALVAALFLVGRGRWRWRERVAAVMAFALGAVVIVPWLLRGYAISGSLPYLGPFIDRLSQALPASGPAVTPGATGSQAAQTATTDVGLTAATTDVDYGVGRSLFDFVRGPWDLTFQGDQYGFPIIGHGEIGIALLMLLPLLLFVPRTRPVALLAVTAVISYVGWWFTPFQIVRHLLPTLAIVAALVGIGFAQIIGAGRPWSRRVLALAAQAGVVAGCLVAPLFFLPSERTQIPVDLLLGRETAAEYVAREIPIAGVFAASDNLPADTLVGYVGNEWEGAQIYTEARLVMDVAPLAPGTTPDDVLASFDRRGLGYFIWNRPATSAEIWRSPLLSMSFLREHARILEGDDGGYLFEIRAGDGAGWDVDEENLLQDPELDRVGDDDGPWTTAGRVRAKRGVISMQPRSSLAQRVAIDGGRPYLLVASGQCPDPEDRAELVLRWFDDDGVEIGAEVERVFPGVEPERSILVASSAGARDGRIRRADGEPMRI